MTAASYVRGPAFGGMRRALRQELDELWLIDLEGDERAARASANVFPIRTPVAIALGVRYGATSNDGPAPVHYTLIGGDARHKLAVLARLGKPDDLGWQVAPDEWDAPLHAAPRTEYWSWPALTELFPWQLSGAQLKRTWPIGSTPEVLLERWRQLLALPLPERHRAFGATRDRDIDASPRSLLDADARLVPLAELSLAAPCAAPVRYAYRAFDRHWVLPDARVGDFMRSSLWRVASPRQVYLCSMLTNVLGPGPAAVVTRYVPDLDHFRGSFGARGVIPLWLDAEATRPNVSAGWLSRLSDAFGFVVSATELMAYCYATLAAPSYTQRFVDELRTPGPRVPLPREATTFRHGVALGRALIDLHTYWRVVPGAARVNREMASSYPTTYRYDPSQEQLVLGEGCFGPVRQEVWTYGVSGYRVVDGWLRRRVRRRGRSPLDAIGPARWEARLTRELLELLWLVEATRALEPALDRLLDQASARALEAAGGVKPAGITDAPRN